MIPPFQNAYVLSGPTGSGKTALGLELAERLGAEIISMDSMALYRGMDIGTAKPSPTERQRVPHHLIDVLEPWESASVAWWLDRASAAVRAIEARGRKVLLVGGTPLYLKAVLLGLFAGPPADAELRARLEGQAEADGAPALHARLAEVDPATASRLHPNDRRRIIRALEVWERTGQPISALQTQWQTGQRGGDVSPPVELEPGDLRPPLAGSPARVLWLDLPRPELYARIDARVRTMFEQGLVEEVRALRQLPQPLSREASQALGYQEVADLLDGKAGLDDTIARVQTGSRNFAKRQLTWFRRLPGCFPTNRQLTFAAWGLTMG
jgi:tRNA dimethylallyltransferase